MNPMTTNQAFNLLYNAARKLAADGEFHDRIKEAGIVVQKAIQLNQEEKATKTKKG